MFLLSIITIVTIVTVIVTVIVIVTFIVCCFRVDVPLFNIAVLVCVCADENVILQKLKIAPPKPREPEKPKVPQDILDRRE